MRNFLGAMFATVMGEGWQAGQAEAEQTRRTEEQFKEMGRIVGALMNSGELVWFKPTISAPVWLQGKVVELSKDNRIVTIKERTKTGHEILHAIGTIQFLEMQKGSPAENTADTTVPPPIVDDWMAKHESIPPETK